MQIEMDENWQEEVQIGASKVPYTLHLDTMYPPGADRHLHLVHQPPSEWMGTPINTVGVPSPTLPRACWFQTRTWKDHRWVIGDWEQGTLHMWGTDYEEFETGPGMYPVGVIEDKTGFVHSISVDRIRVALCT